MKPINKALLFLIFSIQSIYAQLSVSNIFEYQLGNLPNTEPSNLTTHYDQLNISYRYTDFLFSAKFEHFQSKDNSRSYTQVAQRTASFKKDGLELKVGNFYQILGRGLILRTYEIPGVIREDIGLRARYGFYRDIDGFWAGYENNFLAVTAFRGRPIRENLPPTVTDDIRQINLLEAAQANIYLSNWTLTGAYLRNNTEEEFQEYTTLALSANLPFDTQIYTEYARRLGGGTKFFDISNHSSHGLYLSMNIILGSVGFSAEYKDYNEFLLGFNDPPPLVKEHEYLLLNRSTHNLEPVNESGWQTEFFYTFEAGHTIVANASESINESSSRRFIAKEKFVELALHLSPEMLLKGFADYGQEDLRLEKDRYTYGIYAENEWWELWGTSMDIEYQQFQWGLTNTAKVENYAVIFSISYAPDLSLGITWEKTTDPIEPFEQWLGYNLSYQYSQHHLINLFYGKRRGGNACTAGICYQILPFDGFELRLTSNL